MPKIYIKRYDYYKNGQIIVEENILKANIIFVTTICQ